MRSTVVVSCLLALALLTFPGPVQGADFPLVNPAVTEADALLNDSWKLSGKDALGDASIKVQFDGREFSARAASTDIVESSVRAYLSAINRMLDARVEFTAVFAANDQAAYGAMLALYRRGLRVPQDVSVVGFDDLPTSAFMIPSLTTVHRYTDEIGERAAEAMIDLIERRVPNARISAPTLAIRESTRPWRD